MCPAEVSAYPRDLAGYGRDPPDPRWPGGVGVAVQLGGNCGEGGECNIRHGDATAERPLGSYTGRNSVNTLKAVLEEGGFLYSSDSYADDLPYWVNGPKEPHLIIPYTLDANDMRFINAQGFGSGEDFFAYLKDAFDVLYSEGEEAPKMMSVGLHCRLVGRPGRAAALARFLDYIAARGRVWLATRLDIARHWHREHRALAAAAPAIG